MGASFVLDLPDRAGTGLFVGAGVKAVSGRWGVGVKATSVRA
jgi:hypothetical protein